MARIGGTGIGSNRIRCLLAVVASALVLACATMNTVMKSWVGEPIDNLVSSWGAPDSRIARSDGGAVYTWVTVSGDQYGVQQCRQSFTTDSLDIIVGYSFNNCQWFVWR